MNPARALRCESKRLFAYGAFEWLDKRFIAKSLGLLVWRISDPLAVEGVSPYIVLVVLESKY